MNEPGKHAAVKRDVASLRTTIEWLRAEGDLVETGKEVNPDLEITGLQKHFDGKTREREAAAAPLLGTDNDKVFRKVPGLSAPEYAALPEAGAFG